MFSHGLFFFDTKGKSPVFPVHTTSDADYSTFITYHSSIFKNMLNFISQTGV
jgi:hypothetical protein